MLKDLIRQNRSYRRFDESVPITDDMLRDWTECCAYVSSTQNSQALRFRLVTDKALCAETFKHLSWANWLKDWDGPAEGERPVAYVIILCDKEVAQSKPIDDGICAYTLTLAAREAGFGACILGSFKKEPIAEIHALDLERYQIDLIVAFGKEGETVKIVDVEDSTHYYRDENDCHLVPKYHLDDLLV